MKNGTITAAAIILVILATVGVGFVFWQKGSQSPMTAISGSGKSNIDPTKIQAVFLTNGQIYFGKVVDEQAQFVDIKDVHYLILHRPLQSQTDSGDADQSSKPEYNILKLGGEIHGPTSMTINRDHILFIENLSDDSKVVAAMRNMK